MDEPVRWVTKADAAEDLEVRREGRRVFVRMEGEYMTTRSMSLSGPCPVRAAAWSELNSFGIRVGALTRPG